MLRRGRQVSLVVAIYVVVGLFVAYDRDYLTARLLKNLLSAVLAIVLWFLVLLGVNLRIN